MYMDYEALLKLAKEASTKAYAPYSNFKVGCVVISEKGKHYTGCNVENVSFGLTICAERSAVFKGIADEGPSFKIREVVIYTPTKTPVTPCGACRQVLSEFGSGFEVTSACDGENEIRTTIAQLFPQSPDIEINSK